LTILKKKFGRGNNKFAKITKLKQLEQDSWTIDKFVQIFRRVAKESKYKKRALVEEFKRKISTNIRCKLTDTKQLLLSINKYFDRTINLDRNWSESRREKKWKKALILRLNILTNAKEI